VRERIGYVGQRGGSDSQITGRSELIFQCRLFGMSSRAAKERSAELIASLELESCADRKAGTYSGGQRRRLDIAIGLAHRPEVLFLDEPTTGLDPQSRAHLWDEIRLLRTTGTTVFLTTHYLDEADALCERLAIIDHGQIVAEGTPDDLKREISGDCVSLGVTGDPQTALELLKTRAFTREASIEDGTIRLYVDSGELAMPAIFSLLHREGVELRAISLSRPSLDDVFLRHTGRSLREMAA
jgi:ABC-2 type transport system ATP-binding protein